jgi:hypothetical protein
MEFNISEKIDKMPVEFTFSFWVIKIDDDSSAFDSASFDLVNAFNRLYFTANATGTAGTHEIKFKAILNSNGQSVTIPST